MQEYTKPDDLLKTFGKDFQREFQRQNYLLDDLTFAEDFPLLEVIEDAFGVETAMFWLKERFRPFAEMWGPNRDVTERCLVQLAEIVLRDGKKLNVAEICLFVAWVTAGRLGNLYDGSPARVAAAFQTFLTKRREARNRVMAEREAQKAKEEWEARERILKSPEYCRRAIAFFESTGDKKNADRMREKLAKVEGGEA